MSPLATTAHDISRASNDRNRHYFTVSRNRKPHISFRVLFGQTPGLGPVHTDEKYAVIIPQAKAGDDTTYSPGFGGVVIGGERLLDI